MQCHPHLFVFTLQLATLSDFRLNKIIDPHCKTIKVIKKIITKFCISCEIEMEQQQFAAENKLFQFAEFIF